MVGFDGQGEPGVCLYLINILGWDRGWHLVLGITEERIYSTQNRLIDSHLSSWSI